ncbi:Zn-ribbon domain-containing OB-fold protein [Frankia sp. CNm7]|uniref:Zn-ribbon domain-containing OB-fold protein n=1 Tax=Frankia nepalensis TaxID=1836974 RepID=A0A937UPJ2_9ACTN|nr:Zn-ribbon domain-containing OB-fold protein [Frankia nepalensis]MBL7502702.1 Zn-ribbon domain-containing OB-fold protein [Frankia nepalensis]MBL7515857.1 Zn-ribbon domain-containing OB-fold protein [Frankia nepalensis]MBL7521439.1 Zn-ribbon domain-containing OB-fold protein [Frankia nepalensis]MBL7629147.1 Zn-ribbon domain-containing OB-fold protein [Frankia nepalensis]
MTQQTLVTAGGSRPVPRPDEISRFFWDGAGEGRLLLQRCRACGNLQYPPDVCCLNCQSEDLEHTEVSGHGSIYSYAVIERPLHAGFVDAVPYVIALVELVEQPGLRLVTNLVGAAPAQLACGQPVEVVFERRDGITLPQFRLTEASR